MSVYLDGTTLSALLFTHLNSSACQYGFLTGEKIEQVEGRISDSQINTYDVSSYIYISSFVPWPSHHTLYSRGGQIKDESIKSFLTGTEQKLVGWYSFRNNTTARPSLREVTIHNSLATSEMCAGQPKDFLFFLCTSSVSLDMSTHTYSHGFMHVIDGRFESIAMTVMNLGDTTRKDYRNRSTTAVSHSKTVNESLHDFRGHFVKPSGEMDQITKMNHLAVSINKSLKSVHSRLFESEAALGLLETDVDLLRHRLELLEQQESKRMQLQIDKMRQAKKTQFEQMVTYEKEQPGTLLTDLRLPTVDNSYMCNSNSSPCHTAFPLEHCFIGDDFDSLQIIDRTPTLSAEHVEGNSINLSSYCALNNMSSPTVYKYSDSKRGSAEGKITINTHDSKKPQTVKDKVEEAFLFLNEEVRLQKESSPQRNVNASPVKSADMSRVHSESVSKKLASDTRELRTNMEKAHQFSKHVETAQENPSLLDSGNKGRKVTTASALQSV